MNLALQIETTILPGNRIEVRSPELPEGQKARVIVLLEPEQTPKRDLLDIWAEYKGPTSFHTVEEVDAYIRAERDSWDGRTFLKDEANGKR